MLSHYKFNQIKVKTKFFNGYPASVYQRSEVIECLLIDKKIPGSEYATASESALFTIQIKSTTGMYFQQKNIDYKSLKDLVEKMEVLCLR